MVRDLFQLNTFAKRLFICCFVVFAVLCATYGVLLKRTVASVVERRTLERERAELAASVSVLEAKYIAATDSITLAAAYEMGFIKTGVSYFVSRAPDTTLTLDYRNE